MVNLITLTDCLCVGVHHWSYWCGPGHWTPAVLDDDQDSDNIIKNNWMYSSVYLIININKY